MGAKTLSRRERENIRQRNEMLEAALELFAAKGYHNVSMLEIANRAEYSVGTLYKFFENKEDLYKQLVMERARRYHRVLKEALASREENVLETVKKYIIARWQMFKDDLPFLRLYFAETKGASFNIKAGLDQEIRKLFDEVMNELASVLGRGVRSGLFRPIDSDLLALSLEGIIHSFLLSWYVNPEENSYEDRIPIIFDLFLHGSLAE